MQKVIRTYPITYANPTKALKEALDDGYEVVMCHPIRLTGKDDGLEYIVEKKDKGNEQMD